MPNDISSGEHISNVVRDDRWFMNEIGKAVYAHGNDSIEAAAARQAYAMFLTGLKTQKQFNTKADLDKGGVKYDSDKLPLDLLDPLALDGLAAVLQFGARKYASHNWRKGINYSRLIAASMRHLFAILRGEDVDSESGLPHVDHLACCVMFLSNLMKTRKDLDDRHKEQLGELSTYNSSANGSGQSAYSQQPQWPTR